MRVAISGNTYPVRAELDALGGIWNGAIKAWMVPANRAEEAKRLVSQGTVKKPSWRALRTNPSRGRRTGCSCGSVEGQSRSSDCWTCKHDAS